jgi:cytoskeleton protein RodZ
VTELPRTTADPNATPSDSAAAVGAFLRETRESYGLSIDSVSQQLKLHPRQVAALEEGQFDLLPGRTFVRGFLRNYARLLRIDGEALLASLPDTGSTALPPTPPAMGEIRFADDRSRRGLSRWLIPLVLIALVAAAAVYEYLRPPTEVGSAPAVRRDAPVTVPSAPGQEGTPLPNPLATPDAAPPAAGSAAAPSTAAPAADAAAGAPATAPAPGAPEPRSDEGTLVIVWSGPSWAEVKDGSGKTLLTLTGTPGMTQSVSGQLPLDVVIGNVANVSVRFRGSPVDLSPFRKTAVARLKLE